MEPTAKSRQLVANLVDELWEELRDRIVDGTLSREQVTDGLNHLGGQFTDEFEAWEAEADVNGQLS